MSPTKTWLVRFAAAASMLLTAGAATVAKAASPAPVDTNVAPGSWLTPNHDGKSFTAFLPVSPSESTAVENAAATPITVSNVRPFTAMGLTSQSQTSLRFCDINSRTATGAASTTSCTAWGPTGKYERAVDSTWAYQTTTSPATGNVVIADAYKTGSLTLRFANDIQYTVTAKVTSGKVTGYTIATKYLWNARLPDGAYPVTQVTSGIMGKIYRVSMGRDEAMFDVTNPPKSPAVATRIENGGLPVTYCGDGDSAFLTRIVTNPNATRPGTVYLRSTGTAFLSGTNVAPAGCSYTP